MDLTNLDDDALIALAKQALDGDTRAFRALVDRNQGWVRANCRHLTRSGEEEDLAQEVFIKAYFGLQKFERRASFKSWIAKIKANHCMNHLRKQDSRPTFAASLDDVSEARVAVEPQATREIHAEGERLRVAAALESLGDTLRLPLILRDMDEMSYQEIADQLSLKLSAVKMRIKRGREEFRAALLRAEQTGPEGRGPV